MPFAYVMQNAAHLTHTSRSTSHATGTKPHIERAASLFTDTDSKATRHTNVGSRAACTQMAHGGCSAMEIMAVSGHATLAQVQVYVEAVDQKRMAEAAMAKRAAGSNSNPSDNHVSMAVTIVSETKESEGKMRGVPIQRGSACCCPSLSPARAPARRHRHWSQRPARLLRVGR